MSLAGLVSLVAADPSIAAVLQAESDDAIVVPPAATAPTIAALASGVAGRPRPVLAVTATTREADDLVAFLRTLTSRNFPALEAAAALDCKPRR